MSESKVEDTYGAPAYRIFNLSVDQILAGDAEIKAVLEPLVPLQDEEKSEKILDEYKYSPNVSAKKIIELAYYSRNAHVNHRLAFTNLYNSARKLVEATHSQDNENLATTSEQLQKSFQTVQNMAGKSEEEIKERLDNVKFTRSNPVESRKAYNTLVDHMVKNNIPFLSLEQIAANMQLVLMFDRTKTDANYIHTILRITTIVSGNLMLHIYECEIKGVYADETIDRLNNSYKECVKFWMSRGLSISDPSTLSRSL